MEVFRKWFLIAALIGLVCCAVSCSQPTDADNAAAPDKPPVAENPAAPAPTPASGPGVVSGVVTFTGTPPERKPIDMSSDRMCAACWKKRPLTEDALVGKKGEVAWAFVYISDGLPDREYPTPKEEIVLDQIGCIFIPRVVGVMTNQTIMVRNSDSTVHNVRSHPETNDETMIIQYQQGVEEPIALEFAEQAIAISCDYHPWMKAWFHVMDHPYFATTSVDGTFVIKNLPQGEYELTCWHETFGTQTRRITVNGDGPVRETFVYEEK
jgi:hypothetical protein